MLRPCSIFSIFLCYFFLLFLTGCDLSGRNSSITPSFEGKSFTDLIISSNTDEIPIGYSGQFEARIFFSDNSSSIVTDKINWISSDESIAQFDSEHKKLLSGVTQGSVNIQAEYNGVRSNTLSIKVSNKSLANIQVSPADIAIPSSLGFAYQAHGLFSDGSVHDISSDVNWNLNTPEQRGRSSNTLPNSFLLNEVLQINRFGMVSTGSTGDLRVQVAAENVNSNYSSVKVKEVELAEIQITPGNATLAKSVPEQFHAIGFFEDNTSYDLTSFVTWSSQDTSIATISDSGLLTGLSPGTVEISANRNGVDASVNVTVTEKTLLSIQVTPADKTLPLKTTLQYHALGVFSDNTSANITHVVNWKTSSPETALINSKGLLTSIKEGETNVIAQMGNIVGNTSLTLGTLTLESIQVTPGIQTMWPKTISQFTAMGFYSDGSSHDITETASWRALDNTKFTVNKGKITGVTQGETGLIAQKDGVISNQAKVKVLNGNLESIHLSPSNINLPLNTSVQLYANGHYSDNLSHDISHTVDWRSSNTQIATVTPEGRVIANGAGEVNITAYKQGIVSHQAAINVTTPELESIQITPLKLVLPLFVVEQYHAIGYYDDDTQHDITHLVTWHSSDTSVAQVMHNGSTLGAGKGSTTIYANIGDIKSPNANLTITDSELTQIQLEPAQKTLQRDTSSDFSVIGYYSDDTNSDISETVSWVSSNPNIATVTTDGKVFAHNVGEVEILTKKRGLISNRAKITVDHGALEDIQITPAIKTLVAGTEISFTAMGEYSDKTNHDITDSSSWISSNPSIASITHDGIVQAHSLGNIDIHTRKDGIDSNTATVSVVTGNISELTFNLNSVSVMETGSANVELTAIYSGGYHQNVSTSATWQSDNSNIASVSNSGEITGVTAGDTNITASFSGESISIPVSVTYGNLLDIRLETNSVTLISSYDFVAKATADYQSGHQETNSQFFNWRSDDTSVATVSANGKITAVAAGTTQIVAKKDDTSSTPINVTVIDAQLQQIELMPAANRFLVKDIYLQYAAIGHFLDADGNTLQFDITDNVNWNSSFTSKATISNKGKLHTVGVGTTRLSATRNSSSVAVDITVRNAQLSSISLVNKAGNDDLSEGSVRRLHAIGLFDDSTEENIGGKVLWSSNTHLVPFNNHIGTYQATSQGQGTVTIQLNGLSATKNINVLAEGSYPCATPTITANVRDGYDPNITAYSEKTFLCPKTTDEISNEDSDILFDDPHWAPKKMRVATYTTKYHSSHCWNGGQYDGGKFLAAHTKRLTFKDLISALGYSKQQAYLLNYDYGWPVDDCIGTLKEYLGFASCTPRYDLHAISYLDNSYNTHISVPYCLR